MKWLLRNAAIVLLTLAVLYVLWQVRATILLFLLALGLSAALRPTVLFLMRQGMRRGWAMAATYLLMIGLLVALVFLVGEPSFANLGRLSDDLAITYERVLTEWAEQGTPVQRTIARQLPTAQELYASLAGSRGVAIAQAILGIALNLADLISQFALIVILSVYWSTEDARAERLWLSLLPVAARTRVRNAWRELQKSIGEYLRYNAIISVVAGLLLTLFYSKLGLEYVLLLGILAALLRLVPWFGVGAATVLAGFAGLTRGVTTGLTAGGGTLLAFILIDGLLRQWLGPSRHYSSFVTITVLLPLSAVFGLAGMLLAPLIAMILEVPFRQMIEEPRGSTETAAEQLYDLEQRLAQLREQISQAHEPPSPEVVSLLQKIENLMRDAMNVCTYNIDPESNEYAWHCDPSLNPLGSAKV